MCSPATRNVVPHLVVSERRARSVSEQFDKMIGKRTQISSPGFRDLSDESGGCTLRGCGWTEVGRRVSSELLPEAAAERSQFRHESVPAAPTEAVWAKYWNLDFFCVSLPFSKVNFINSHAVQCGTTESV